MNFDLVFFQHFHLRACSGVCVERFHLLIEQPLSSVKLGFLSLKVYDLCLQLIHTGVLHCGLKLMLLHVLCPIDTNRKTLQKHSLHLRMKHMNGG